MIPFWFTPKQEGTSIKVFLSYLMNIAIKKMSSVFMSISYIKSGLS
nr:MAG TPA: hypothetical protein [Caudoviricetes sp.]